MTKYGHELYSFDVGRQVLLFFTVIFDVLTQGSTEIYNYYEVCVEVARKCQIRQIVKAVQVVEDLINFIYKILAQRVKFLLLYCFELVETYVFVIVSLVCSGPVVSFCKWWN